MIIIQNELINLIPKDSKVVFACIGTDRSTGDCLGPIVGMLLEEKGYNVVGTLEDPMHAVNLEERSNKIKEDYPDHIVIAIDACLSSINDIGKIMIHAGPLFPGKAVKKVLPPVGDISIKGIVNVSGFMEYSVLQNTRLNTVWKMAKEIERICDEAMDHQNYSSIEVYEMGSRDIIKLNGSEVV